MRHHIRPDRRPGATGSSFAPFSRLFLHAPPTPPQTACGCRDQAGRLEKEPGGCRPLRSLPEARAQEPVPRLTARPVTPAHPPTGSTSESGSEDGRAGRGEHRPVLAAGGGGEPPQRGGGELAQSEAGRPSPGPTSRSQGDTKGQAGSKRLPLGRAGGHEAGPSRGPASRRVPLRRGLHHARGRTGLRLAASPFLRSGSLPLAFLGKYFTRKMEATQSRLCCGVRFTGSPSNLKTEGPSCRAWARSWRTAGVRTPGAPSSCILCSTHTAPHRGAGGGGQAWGAPQSGGSVKPGVVRPERQTHYLSCWF